MPELSTLGQRVADLQAARGWTTKDLNRKSGVPYSALYNLTVSGDQPNLRSDSLEKLANTLETSVDYLLGRTDDPAPPSRTPPADDLADLFRRARALGVSPQLIEAIQNGLPNLPRDIAEELIAGLRADLAVAEAKRETELHPPASPNAHGPQPRGGPVQPAAQTGAAPRYTTQARQPARRYINDQKAEYCPTGEG